MKPFRMKGITPKANKSRSLDASARTVKARARFPPTFIMFVMNDKLPVLLFLKFSMICAIRAMTTEIMVGLTEDD